MSKLVEWDKIEHQIDEARDLKTIVQMQEQVEAIKILIKQTDGSLKAQNRCSRYRIFLEQKAGMLYRQAPSEEGKRTDLTWETDFPRLTPKQEIIKETGKTKPIFHKWVKESEIPKEKVLEYETLCNKEGKELTSAGLLYYAQEEKSIDSPPIPKNVYRIIYADPPWKYTEQGLTGVSDSYHRGDEYGNIPKHYKPMTIKELCNMKMPKTEDNAVLFLWVTWPFLEKSFKVIEAWGFKYKTGIVWDKIKHNFGYYVSVRSELLLICTKGSCTPDVKVLHDNVVSIERTKHSEKPERFREIIDEIYPKGNRIELFARKKVKNWDAWGLEV
ncbi:MAG: MT-A70 family methyltransferase [Promethearchaeota archaeon]